MLLLVNPIYLGFLTKELLFTEAKEKKEKVVKSCLPKIIKIN